MTPGHTAHTAPKQFLELDGVPIVILSLRRIAACPLISEIIVATRADVDRATFPAVMVGHVGDGNFHVQCLLGPDQTAEADAFAERLVERAQRMGGTCSGEHGVGSGKKKYLKAEHGEGLEVMRMLKRTLDPENRMNPGKVLDLD